MVWSPIVTPWLTDALRQIEEQNPMLTFPAMVTPEDKLEKSDITESCPNDAFVFKRQNLPSLALAFTIVPAINTAPSGTKISSAKIALGCTMGMNSIFGAIFLSSRR